MAYKIKYDDEAAVITVILGDKGKLSYAEDVGDIVVHFDEDEKPLFMEMLRKGLKPTFILTERKP